MAISEVSSPGVTAVGNSATPSITHGLIILADDIVVCCINHNTTTAAMASDAGNDFSELYEVMDGGSSTGVFAVYSKKSAGSEPASYTFTPAGGAAQFAIVVRVFRGCDTTSWWDVTPGAGTWAQDVGVGTTATSTDMTIVTAGALGVMFGITDTTAYPFSWGSPTNSWGTELQTAGTYPLYSTTRACASTGAIGTMDCTLSASQDWQIILGALKPAGGTPTFTGLTVTRLLQG
jgi:hypothetical protein